MRTAQTLLAVDLSYQAYRAAAAHPRLTSGRTFTGGLYGFLATLGKQVRETGATQLLICDDVKPYRRSDEYPDYKMLRRGKTDEDLLAAYKVSKKLILELLEDLGVPVMALPGFESDDCIGWLVRQHRHRFVKIIAASNDSDLFQLLDCPNFVVLQKGVEDWVDLQKLKKVHGLTPAEFMLASALMGTHNDIAGIPGVGPVTAAKAVREPSLLRTYRERWGEVIDRNLRLIQLPHRDFPKVDLPGLSARFDPRALYRFCGRYDIEVTKPMVDAFAQTSSLSHEERRK